MKLTEEEILLIVEIPCFIIGVILLMANVGSRYIMIPTMSAFVWLLLYMIGCITDKD